jgi:hypothetical protein
VVGWVAGEDQSLSPNANLLARAESGSFDLDVEKMRAWEASDKDRRAFVCWA